MKKSFSDKTPMTCCYRKHAVLFGYIEAVLLFHFMFWIDFNRKKEQHFHDERYWTYSSISTLHKSYFPFFSEGQIRWAIDSLFKQDYNKGYYQIVTKNNKDFINNSYIKHNKGLWYKKQLNFSNPTYSFMKSKLLSQNCKRFDIDEKSLFS